MPPKPSVPPDCPCGLPQSYAECCGRFLDGGQVPVTAEELMRSRYVAYTLRREEYLLRTWHPHTRPGALNLEEEGVHWLGLKVLDTAGARPMTPRARSASWPATRSVGSSRVA